jgi:peptide/nickel transport system permease protein
MSFFPGIAILLTVLAINLVGEGLNDVLNPRISRK